MKDFRVFVYFAKKGVAHIEERDLAQRTWKKARLCLRRQRVFQTMPYSHSKKAKAYRVWLLLSNIFTQKMRPCFDRRILVSFFEQGFFWLFCAEFCIFCSEKSQLTNRTMNDTWMLKILRLTKELNTAWLFSKLGNIRTIPLVKVCQWQSGGKEV